VLQESIEVNVIQYPRPQSSVDGGNISSRMFLASADERGDKHPLVWVRHIGATEEVIDPRARYPQSRCFHRPRLFEEKISMAPTVFGFRR